MHEIETTDVLLKPGEKKELFLVNMHEAKHNFFVFKQQKETETRGVQHYSKHSRGTSLYPL